MTEIISCVDRIAEDVITCVDDEEKTTRHLQRSAFPFLGEGDVILIKTDGDRILDVTLLEEETQRRRQTASARLRSLFNRSQKQ